jgi:hypothetical protein
VGAARTAGEPAANAPGRPKSEHVDGRPTVPGIPAAELATARLSAVELERWLVANAFATVSDGRLVPTRRAVELVEALTP